MARPLTPLISRSSAVTASLEIIDTEGLNAFSLPKLAKFMGVSAPSLYYHFSDKSELLSAVARRILGAGRIPNRMPGPDWPEYFVELGLNLRSSVLRHRNAAPVLLQYMSRDLLIGPYEETAEFLAASGVPEHLHVRILDGMERISIGASLTEAMRKPSTPATIFPNVDHDEQPALAKALEANELTSRMLFEELVRGFLHGVMRDAAGVVTGAGDAVVAEAGDGVAAGVGDGATPEAAADASAP